MAINKEDQLNLLKKYYAYDDKTKTFNVVLHYDKVSEILYQDVQSISKVPLMNESFFENVTLTLNDIPRGYYADISLVIDDYEGYDEKTILESFNDMLEFGRLKFRGYHEKKYFKFAALLSVGIVLLFFSAFAEDMQWWKIFSEEPLIRNVLNRILEISAWVFVWEAVYVLFLDENEDVRRAYLIMSRLNRFSLSNKNGDKVLISEDYEEIEQHFNKGRANQRFGSVLLVTSGFAFLALASSSAMRLLGTMPHQLTNLGYFRLALNWVWIVLSILGGICAIKLSSGKEKYRIPAVVYAGINILFIVSAIVAFAIQPAEASFIVLFIISVIFEITYCIGLFLSLNLIKKKKQ